MWNKLANKQVTISWEMATEVPANNSPVSSHCQVPHSSAPLMVRQLAADTILRQWLCPEPEPGGRTERHRQSR